MNFHAHQDTARAVSRQLVLLLLGAIVLLTVAVNSISVLLWQWFTDGSALPQYFVATNTAIVLLYVLGGAWLEWQRLSEGGSGVALRLGARHPNPYDARHRRLVNVTEEIAIAAGVPVPELFVLDHDGINAMMAGIDPASSAMVLTSGALEMLERHELQAVVAHEIAHLVNGDVAINTRLAGALYGLFSLHLLGRAMISSVFFDQMDSSGRRRIGLTPWSPIMLLMGSLMLAAGWLGTLAARLVQAGVSRQREYLADAKAVEFTRDRDAMGVALRKVAGQQVEPMANDYAQVVAHFWLVGALADRGWLDSHPPLADRIRRLYGRWRPAIVPVRVDVRETDSPAPDLAPLMFSDEADEAAMLAPSRRPVTARHLAEVPAMPCDEHLPENEPARESVHSLMMAGSRQAGPAALLISAVRDVNPTLSRAALLLNAIVAGPTSESQDDPASDPGLQQALLWLERPEAQWLRVPLIELLSARLRAWPTEYRRTLVRYCHDAVLADGRVEKTEWVYYTLVRHRLLPEEQERDPVVQNVDKRKALAEVFAMAGLLTDQSARSLREAVVRAAEAIGVQQPALTPEQFQFGSLTRALDVLRAMPPLRKPALLRILATLPREGPSPLYRGFLAAVAAAIDCPPMRVAPGRPTLDQNGAGQPSASQMAS